MPNPIRHNLIPRSFDQLDQNVPPASSRQSSSTNNGVEGRRRAFSQIDSLLPTRNVLARIDNRGVETVVASEQREVTMASLQELTEQDGVTLSVGEGVLQIELGEGYQGSLRASLMIRALVNRANQAAPSSSDYFETVRIISPQRISASLVMDTQMLAALSARASHLDNTDLNIEVGQLDLLDSDFLYNISALSNGSHGGDGLRFGDLFQAGSLNFRLNGSTEESVDERGLSNQREVTISSAAIRSRHHRGQGFNREGINQLIQTINTLRTSDQMEQGDSDVLQCLNRVALTLASYQSQFVDILMMHVSSFLEMESVDRGMIDPFGQQIRGIIDNHFVSRSRLAAIRPLQPPPRFPGPMDRMAQPPMMRRHAMVSMSGMASMRGAPSMRANPHVRFNLEEPMRGFSISNATEEIELHRGQEFEQLTAYSRAHPGKSFKATFSNEPGVDQGGIKREALSFALDSLAAQHLIRLSGSERQYVINDVGTVQAEHNAQGASKRETIAKFHKLGHLLAMTALERHFKTDLEFQVEDFEAVFQLVPFFERVIDIPLNGERPSAGQSQSGLEDANQRATKAISDFIAYVLNDIRSSSDNRDNSDNHDSHDNSINPQELMLSLLQSDQSRAQFHELMAAAKKPLPLVYGDYVPGNRPWLDSLPLSSESKAMVNLMIAASGEPIHSPAQFIDTLVDMIGAKIALAKGFDEVNQALEPAKRFTDAEAMHRDIVNHYDLQAELQRAKASASEGIAAGDTTYYEQDFFDNHFTVILPSRYPEDSEAAHDITCELQAKMIYMVENMNREQLRDTLRYVTGTPTFNPESKIVLMVQHRGDSGVPTRVRDIPLPEAHSCASQLDIDVRALTQEDYSDALFLETMVSATRLQQQFGNGFA